MTPRAACLATVVLSASLVGCGGVRWRGFVRDRPRMPAFQGQLSATQIRQVAEFVAHAAHR